MLEVAVVVEEAVIPVVSEELIQTRLFRLEEEEMEAHHHLLQLVLQVHQILAAEAAVVTMVLLAVMAAKVL
jgi:hypothetical protein